MDCSPPGPSVRGDSPYWSGLPCSPPGVLPDPEIEPSSPTLADGYFTTNAIWEACVASESETDITFQWCREWDGEPLQWFMSHYFGWPWSSKVTFIPRLLAYSQLYFPLVFSSAGRKPSQPPSSGQQCHVSSTQLKILTDICIYFNIISQY